MRLIVNQISSLLRSTAASKRHNRCPRQGIATAKLFEAGAAFSRARPCVVPAVLMQISIGLFLALMMANEPAWAGISLRSVTTGGDPYGALSSVTIAVPPGVQPGDTLIAQIAVRLPSRAPLLAPAGWTLVRRDQSLGQERVSTAIFYRIVPGTGEAASSYTWAFPPGNNAVGGIAAYSGVDPDSPIDASSGQGNSESDATAIDAPSLTIPTGRYGDLLICSFTVADGSPVTLPAGIEQRWGVHPPSFGVFAAMGDVQIFAGTSTSPEVALASVPRPNVGQQIALKPLSASAWPMSGHDARRTGQSPVDTSANGGTIKWSKASAHGNPFSSPALGADGTIYLDGEDNSLMALAPNSTQKWQFTGSLETVDSFGQPETLADPLTTTPVVGPDGTIYAGSAFGDLYALTTGGVEKWVIDSGFEDPFNLSPPPITGLATGADGTFYFVAGSVVRAINPDSSSRWTFVAEEPLRGSLAIGPDGTIYAGAITAPADVYAITPQGAAKWKSTFDAAGSLAVAGDGTIYVEWEDTLYALNPSDGSQEWRFVGSGTLTAPGIGIDSTIYVGSQDTHLYALMPNGSEKWDFVAEGPIESSPSIGADGNIYFGTAGSGGPKGNGNFDAVAASGTERWHLTTNGAVVGSPAIGPDGTIYATSENGRFYAIR